MRSLTNNPLYQGSRGSRMSREMLQNVLSQDLPMRGGSRPGDSPKRPLGDVLIDSTYANLLAAIFGYDSWNNERIPKVAEDRKRGSGRLLLSHGMVLRHTKFGRIEVIAVGGLGDLEKWTVVLHGTNMPVMELFYSEWDLFRNLEYQGTFDLIEA